MVAHLASPQMEGRGPGTAGIDRARDWIAAEFKAAGLEPAFGDSYLQELTIPNGVRVADQALAILPPRGAEGCQAPFQTDEEVPDICEKAAPKGAAFSVVDRRRETLERRPVWWYTNQGRVEIVPRGTSAARQAARNRRHDVCLVVYPCGPVPWGPFCASPAPAPVTSASWKAFPAGLKASTQRVPAGGWTAGDARRPRVRPAAGVRLGARRESSCSARPVRAARKAQAPSNAGENLCVKEADPCLRTAPFCRAATF